jgi:putative ABC transport system permease protein
VFSKDSLTSFARSRLPLSDVQIIARLPGVAAAGAMGALPARLALPRGTADIAVMGILAGQPGAPTTVSSRLLRPGEAVVDPSLRSAGVRLGSTIRALAGGPPLRVAGFVTAGQYELLPAIWTTMGSWQQLSAAAAPETRGSQPWAQVLTIRLAPGASAAQVAGEVSARLGGVDAVAPGQAVLAIPGAVAMRSTIQQLIVAVLAVTLLVAALFAALYTTERRVELARLRALGASARHLASGVLVQVELPVILAFAVGYAVTGGLLAAAPPTFPAALPLARVLALGTLIAVAGALGAAGTIVTVVRIDPATAMEET